jgi:hypothetical protein
VLPEQRSIGPTESELQQPHSCPFHLSRAPVVLEQQDILFGGGQEADILPFQVHRRLRVVIKSYDAAGGLSNQFYCHVSMIAIALAAGAEIAVSKAWHRNSTFGMKYTERVWPNVRSPRLVAQCARVRVRISVLL